MSVYPHLPARRPARAPPIPTTPSRAQHRSDDAHHRSRRPHRARTTDPDNTTSRTPSATHPLCTTRRRKRLPVLPSASRPGFAGYSCPVLGHARHVPRRTWLARRAEGQAPPRGPSPAPPRSPPPAVAHPRGRPPPRRPPPGRPPPACTTRRRTRLPVLPWASSPGSGCYSCPTPTTTSPMCTTRRRTRLPVLPWTSRPGSGGYSCSNVDVAAATPLSDSEVTTSHSCV